MGIGGRSLSGRFLLILASDEIWNILKKFLSRVGGHEQWFQKLPTPFASTTIRRHEDFSQHCQFALIGTIQLSDDRTGISVFRLQPRLDVVRLAEAPGLVCPFAKARQSLLADVCSGLLVWQVGALAEDRAEDTA
jgi:hypothetical protein